MDVTDFLADYNNEALLESALWSLMADPAVPSQLTVPPVSRRSRALSLPDDLDSAWQSSPAVGEQVCQIVELASNIHPSKLSGPASSPFLALPTEPSTDSFAFSLSRSNSAPLTENFSTSFAQTNHLQRHSYPTTSEDLNELSTASLLRRLVLGQTTEASQPAAAYDTGLDVEAWAAALEHELSCDLTQQLGRSWPSTPVDENTSTQQSPSPVHRSLSTDGETEQDDRAQRPKRRRRTNAELLKTYVCACGRGYASEHSLTQHIRIKHTFTHPSVVRKMKSQREQNMTPFSSLQLPSSFQNMTRSATGSLSRETSPTGFPSMSFPFFC